MPMHPSACHRLDYDDIICDGFYEPIGDFPEIVEKGEFPTLGQLRHVQCFDSDPREVSTAQWQRTWSVAGTSAVA